MRNATVVTLDESDSRAQAVAIAQGRIVYVGDDIGAFAYRGPRTRVVDLGGRMLMPGLVDAHMHPSDGGAQLLACNLNYKPLPVAAVRERIQACLKAGPRHGSRDWLTVVNWDRQGTSTLDRDPTRADLDSLDTPRPIVVTSTDGHTLWVNSRGLVVAGITRDTPAPAGGAIGHDATGALTGTFEDEAADLINERLPVPSPQEKIRSARAALAVLARAGVTAFLDAQCHEEDVKPFFVLQQRGELTARAHFALVLSPAEAAGGASRAVAGLRRIARKYDQGEPRPSPGVNVQHVKLFMDGVIAAPAQTAALLAPYWVNRGTATAPDWGPGERSGSVYFAPEVLNPLVVEIVKAGFDPHIHATGDKSVRLALDAYEFARQALPDSRFRPGIAHTEAVDPADLPRFRALDVFPVMSFQWAQQAPYSMGAAREQLGPERYARMEPEGSLMNAGAPLAFGSDWPVDPLEEFLALKIGVTRRGDPTHPASYGPEYAGRINDDPLLPRGYALRTITGVAARSLRLEAVAGAITPGRFADLIVLDRDFLRAPEEDLARTQVLLTLVGGKVVYAAAPFRGATSPPVH